MDSASSYTPIDCDLHDYIEIACLHRYEVRIRLRDGAEFVGTAKTTQAKNGVEKLVLFSAGSSHAIRLDHLAHLLVLSPNSTFRDVSFVGPVEPS